MDLLREAPEKLAQFALAGEASQWVSQLLETLTKSAEENRLEKLKNQSLILELAHLRRMRFGASSEAIAAVHYDLFDEMRGESGLSDIADIEAQIQSVQSANADTSAPSAHTARSPRQGAGRQTLPAHLPRIEHWHDLPQDEQGRCSCNTCGALLKLIGEDVSEQLDVTPAKFFVHRHIRPQYACKSCETVVAAPIPAAIIDGGMAAPGLIAWTLTSKFVDHLPLYRLEQIAARSQVNLARSTLAAWVGRYGVALTPLVDRLRALLLQRAVLHADETPVQQLAPGKGKTQRAYLWAYCSSALDVGEPEIERAGDVVPIFAAQVPTQCPIVVFDYQTSRAGAHARHFLQDWGGHLMVDDYVGYKALFESTASGTTSGTTSGPRIIELGCMAHARRKFFELHAANKSLVALEALNRIGALYAIEKHADEANLTPTERAALRQAKAKPLLSDMNAWLTATRMNTANGSALAKAMDYSLRRWVALARYAQSGTLPIDNNAIENAIRPIALGKKNWLFAGSERAGKRAAAIQSLLATAKRNGIEPQAWLKDVIEKLPAWPNSRIDELLPFAHYRLG